MSPELLARSLQQFIAEECDGLVIEDGQILFDLANAQYSISAERGRCLLHLWSHERNLVREVIDAESKNGTLALSVRRFAQARPHKLEICRDRDRRSTTAKNGARKAHARLLERVLRRQSPEWVLDKPGLTTTMDLERSFSPIYARGLLRRGTSSFAVFGVNSQETQASIDAALTFALIWLDSCREREPGRSVVQGLRLYFPPQSSTAVQIRLGHLNHQLARFQLFEFDERDESLAEIDCSDMGNIETRLVRCPDAAQARARFSASIQRILAIAPKAEIAVLSPAEIAFRLHGLEFARVRAVNVPGSFRIEEELVFGAAGFQERFSPEKQEIFEHFVKTVSSTRTLSGDHRDPLWRMYPERWLESLVFDNVSAIDSRLNPAHVYSQVPAFSASDRAMIDVLTSTREGRLAVLELKADEDINLPLQGLDYWARVRWHHSRSEFPQFGYFPGVQLSDRPPLLFLVAPSLRVHPALDTILRYFSREIEWMLVGVDERWREGIRVIYRKSSPA
jgi:hypothetical protein